MAVVFVDNTERPCFSEKEHQQRLLAFAERHYGGAVPEWLRESIQEGDIESLECHGKAGILKINWRNR